MPERRCPLCRQPLPHALTQIEIDSRLEKLASPALTEERRRLEKELENRLRAERAKARLQAEQRLRKEMAQAVRGAKRDNEVKLQKLQTEREKDRTRHEAESARLQGQLDALSRKLEKQSGERLGEEGEMDLVAELEHAFPKDRVERIGRGKAGADVIHYVMDGANPVGRIVYENKNTAGWQNAFVAQASKYRTQYETPYVIIVTRAFPRKHRDFCITKDIPLVCPRMAVSLASVMREGVLAIGRLRMSGASRAEKANELLQYLLSDRFVTRFKAIAESVEGLRQHQRKERNWHEDAWEAQTTLHERIDKNHREINSQLNAVLATKRPVAVAARA